MSLYGFCHLSVIPVRETPSDLSQMTTQLMFGDVFEIIETQKNWLQIKNAFDEYIGWIDQKQQLFVEKDIFKRFSSIAFTNTQTGNLLVNNEIVPVLPGSNFPIDETFTVNHLQITPKLPLKLFTKSNKIELREYALSYLNAPYLWGGKSPFGIDCSGFTQSVFKMAGIVLKRDAWQQARQGETINFLAEAQMGDLAFFDNEEERIVHVGILLNATTIIHASGKVRIDAIDHQGIYNAESKSYSHQLRIIKRLF